MYLVCTSIFGQIYHTLHRDLPTINIPLVYFFAQQGLAFQNEQKIERVIKRARFPKRTTLDGFDFDFQPSINKKEILDLKYLGFLEKKEKLIFMGNPGVGKTHLVIAVGIQACKQGHRTLFNSCH